jgi:hypothetical protein
MMKRDITMKMFRLNEDGRFTMLSPSEEAEALEALRPKPLKFPAVSNCIFRNGKLIWREGWEGNIDLPEAERIVTLLNGKTMKGKNLIAWKLLVQRSGPRSFDTIGGEIDREYAIPVDADQVTWTNTLNETFSFTEVVATDWPIRGRTYIDMRSDVGSPQ